MSEQTNPIISFKNFSFQYRAQKKPTLHDINLDIYPGERVLIAGPSGSGKSTLAACINGLNPFSNPGECTGSLTVDGVDAPNSSIFELSAHVGTVLQDPDGQFIGLTVGEDIAFALENSCVPQRKCTRSPAMPQSWWALKTAWTMPRMSFPAGRSSASAWRVLWWIRLKF